MHLLGHLRHFRSFDYISLKPLDKGLDLLPFNRKQIVFFIFVQLFLDVCHLCRKILFLLFDLGRVLQRHHVNQIKTHCQEMVFHVLQQSHMFQPTFELFLGCAHPRHVQNPEQTNYHEAQTTGNDEEHNLCLHL